MFTWYEFKLGVLLGNQTKLDHAGEKLIEERGSWEQQIL